MSHHTVFECPDQIIRVVSPAPKARLGNFNDSRGGAFVASIDKAGGAKFMGFAESEEEWVARIKANTLRKNPHLKGAKELPDATLPTDRRFRNCWRCPDSEKVEVDMPLARAQRMAEIRAERDAKLHASDGPILREQEQGTKATVDALKAKRQALRDIPTTFDLEPITMPSALADFEPEWPE